MTPIPPPVVFGGWFITILAAGLFSWWCAWGIAFDRGFEEADGQRRRRHRHRIGDPQETTLLELPRAGRLEPLTPMPPPHSEWTFFGAEVLPEPGPAEYELLTAPTISMTAATVEMKLTLPGGDETPSDFTRRNAREVDAFIKRMDEEGEQRRRQMREESNYFQHAMLGDRR